jgi:hypothetical protein
MFRHRPDPRPRSRVDAPLPALASQLFDARFYLEEYPDAVDSGYAPLDHYLVAGIAEGRRIRPGVALRAEREPAWTEAWTNPASGPASSVQAAVAATAHFRRQVGAGALARDRYSIQVAAARSAGVLLAPVGVALVAAAVRAAEASGLPTVHYLSREGRVLQRIHDAVAPVLSTRTISSRHLPLSRLATFGPSLTGASPIELRRLWRMYPDQSPAALLTSLGLDPAGLEGPLRAHGLEPGRVIPGIADDPSVAGFLADEEVRSMLDRALAAHRARLRDFLLAEVTPGGPTADEVLVVDIGWRGSIQDNLAHVVPDWQWTGWYLGLLPFLNDQPPNTTKHAVGPDANRGDDVSWLGPSHVLELALSSQEPSAVGFDVADDGTVAPRFVATGGDGPGGRLAAELQAGMMLSVRAVARAFRDAEDPLHQLRPVLDGLLWNLLHDPPPGLADVVLESAHDETFGTLNVLPFEEPEVGTSSVWADSTTTALDRVAALGTRSRWPAGWRRWQPVRTLRASLGDRMP